MLAAAVLLAPTHALYAQTPTGTITGRVNDPGDLAVPGATVTVASPNLQGTRSTVTSVNGDYIFPGLPPGSYTVTVELSGFATTKQTRDVGAGQPVQVDVTLRPAAVSEVVTVTARADAFTNTVQASTNIQQELLATLPTARTILSAVNLSPAAHATGPNNAITIGGAMSADNLFMLDGVQIQDNLRGTPFSLFIEDAIQETTVSTSGISAEYGRFTGGVVNAITRSGGDRVQRIAAHDVHQRRLADDEPVRRAEGQRHGADLRVHDRRADREEPHLVLRRRPLLRSVAGQRDGLYAIGLHVRQRREAVRGQDHASARHGPQRPRVPTRPSAKPKPTTSGRARRR